MDEQNRAIFTENKRIPLVGSPISHQPTPDGYQSTPGPKRQSASVIASTKCAPASPSNSLTIPDPDPLSPPDFGPVPLIRSAPASGKSSVDQVRLPPRIDRF